MTDKQIIIDDQKKTIHRLQDECTEKTNTIIALGEQLKRIEQELKVEKQDKKYIKECCIRAGKELSKHSFEWDGKEKNLVVQAMQLNEDYERLERENEELQKRFNDYQDRKIEENANLMKKLDIADKKLTVFSRELEQANKEIKKKNKQ